MPRGRKSTSTKGKASKTNDKEAKENQEFIERNKKPEATNKVSLKTPRQSTVADKTPTKTPAKTTASKTTAGKTTGSKTTASKTTAGKTVAADQSGRKSSVSLQNLKELLADMELSEEESNSDLESDSELSSDSEASSEDEVRIKPASIYQNIEKFPKQKELNRPKVKTTEPINPTPPTKTGIYSKQNFFFFPNFQFLTKKNFFY